MRINVNTNKKKKYKQIGYLLKVQKKVFVLESIREKAKTSKKKCTT